MSLTLTEDLFHSVNIWWTDFPASEGPTHGSGKMKAKKTWDRRKTINREQTDRRKTEEKGVKGGAEEVLATELKVWDRGKNGAVRGKSWRWSEGFGISRKRKLNPGGGVISRKLSCWNDLESGGRGYAGLGLRGGTRATMEEGFVDAGGEESWVGVPVHQRVDL